VPACRANLKSGSCAPDEPSGLHSGGAAVLVEHDDDHHVPALEVERRPTRERMIELARLAIKYELPPAEQPVIDFESNGRAKR
jgi:hypothetical protein